MSKPFSLVLNKALKSIVKFSNALNFNVTVFFNKFCADKKNETINTLFYTAISWQTTTKFYDIKAKK